MLSSMVVAGSCASNPGTCGLSNRYGSVTSTTCIACVARSMARCTYGHPRRYSIRCCLTFHLPLLSPQNFSPVLSISQCSGSCVRRIGMVTFNLACRRLMVRSRGTFQFSLSCRTKLTTHPRTRRGAWVNSALKSVSFASHYHDIESSVLPYQLVDCHTWSTLEKTRLLDRLAFAEQVIGGPIGYLIASLGDFIA